MIINMNDEHLTSVADAALFTKAADKMEFAKIGNIAEKYIWVEADSPASAIFPWGEKPKEK